MPIKFAEKGTESIIKRIGGKPDVRRFLESLGFTVGTTVSVLSEISGNLIIQVKDSRIAVSREMAEKIYI